MNPIDPAELSALLDGELSPERACEVEAAIARDPELRAQLEQLRILDLRWRSAACTAAFRPQIFAENASSATAQTAPGGRLARVRNTGFIWILAALMILRFLPKLTDLPLLSVSLHAVALAIVVACADRVISTLDVQEGPAAPAVE